MKIRQKCEIVGCDKLASLGGHYETKDGKQAYWRKRCQKHHLIGDSGNLSTTKSGNPSATKVTLVETSLERKRRLNQEKIDRVRAGAPKPVEID